jgi:V/A-type H+-transporting ATPase subunit K
MGVMKSVAQTSQASIQEPVSVGEIQDVTGRHDDPGVVKYAFLAAAIAVGIGSLGAGAAVGYVGAAAMGAIGEKPELAGRALIFVGLAEGIAIYGLIIAIMILGKV